MRVSVNTVKQLAGIELPPIDQLVDRINRRLGGVEDVIDLGERYKHAVIVRVVSCEKHQNADKLSVCRVDDAGVVKGVDRDEDGFVQVVCGAPNVATGITAVWLPPGSTVPASYNDKEPFVLSKREIRGIVSNGMLAAGDELAINGDHDGIVSLTEADVPEGKVLSVGASFAETFELDDILIEIENKMFTHRPDLFGQLGVAREIYAILQTLPDEDPNFELGFARPDWYWKFPHFTPAQGLPLEVFNDSPDVAPRFMAVVKNNVTVASSPLWLQTTLLRWGGKAINNVVDLTNYIMLLTAQPTHAYDYDKLRGNKLGVRMAKPGENVTLINGKTYELVADDIVIVDGEGPVGLAGIMGGGNSEVSDITKNIVLEVANFDMYAVRRSAMRHGIFTDALTRFNKGQSPLQNDRVLSELMRLTPGRQASGVYDLPVRNDPNQESVHVPIKISTEFINKRLGLQLSTEQVRMLLRLVNFATNSTGEDRKDILEITAPFWRTDIEIPEDIVEEVGRLYGFENAPLTLPHRSIQPVKPNALVAAKRQIRDMLSGAGANEVLTYSFVHEKLLRRAGQEPAKAYQLSNALSPDLQYYRLSLAPSLLERVHANVKSGYDEFLLYELGKAHHKDAVDDDGLPKELGRLAGVYAQKKAPAGVGAAYYVARRYVDELVTKFGLKNVQYVPLHKYAEHADADMFKQLCAPFQPERAAVVVSGELLLGVVGEYKIQVARDFKLPEHTAGFELFLSPFVTVSADTNYVPLSRFPRVTQDMSLRVDQTVRFEEVYQACEGALHSVRTESLRLVLSPLGVYQPENVAEKTITLRLTAVHYDKTLTDSEVSVWVSLMAQAAKETVNARLV